MRMLSTLPSQNFESSSRFRSYSIPPSANPSVKPPAGSDGAADLPPTLSDLQRQRASCFYRKRQNIVLNPNDIWVVHQGVVQLGTIDPDGNEVLLGLAVPSMPLGLPLTWVNPYQATALSDVQMMRFTLAEIESSPNLRYFVMRNLERRLQQSEALQSILGYRLIKDRLYHLLLLLKREVGEPSAQGVRLSVRLTHQDLANTIGTTRVTITRLLGLLREEGCLTFDRRHHIVLPYSES
jgi:CRP-like cAMP-binding protein